MNDRLLEKIRQVVPGFLFRIITISVSAVLLHMFMPSSASAFDFAAPFTDPLFALPDRIESGTNSSRRPRTDTLQAATALAKATLEKYRALGDYRKAVAALAVSSRYFSRAITTHSS